MDYKGRLERARREMRRRGIGLMYLPRGANLFYLAGIRRGDPELTDHNTYGNYVQGAYIGADEDLILIGPRMGGAAWRKEAEDKPHVAEVRIIDETESPKRVMEEVVGRFRLNGRGISVDDRAWSQTTLLLRGLALGSEITLASEILDPMRMVKDADEIALMKKSAEITDESYVKVVEVLREGMTEIEVAQEVDRQLARHGAERNSFVTGIRFRSPKHPWALWGPSEASRKLEEGDTISFDFGCVYKGYCSDFGRTAYVGNPPEKVNEIHGLVVKAQAAAIERMVDGAITAQELDMVARKIIEKAGFGECFVHRLGHGIGVTVHEPPFLYIPDDTLLRKDMTFTVEPSIILPNSWSARVEDVVRVTENRGETLSNYPKELTAI